VIGFPTVFFSTNRLTGIFDFGLPIIDRIESPTTAVIMRLYSDNDIDSAPADSSMPAIAVDSLVPRTRPVLRFPRTRPAAMPASAGYVADSSATTLHQLAHPLHRWSAFVVIARNFIDHDVIASDLRVFIHTMAHTALASV
jgi:hypothetical protein